MLGILTEIVGVARSNSSIGERWSSLKSDRSDTADQNSAPESTLFQCTACGNVYVAVTKTECGHCDGAVTEIDDTPER